MCPKCGSTAFKARDIDERTVRITCEVRLDAPRREDRPDGRQGGPEVNPFKPSIDALIAGLVVGVIIVAILIWWFFLKDGDGGGGV